MNKAEERLLGALRHAIRGETVSRGESVSQAELQELIHLAHIHRVLPMVVEAICPLISLR